MIFFKRKLELLETLLIVGFSFVIIFLFLKKKKKKLSIFLIIIQVHNEFGLWIKNNNYI